MLIHYSGVSLPGLSGGLRGLTLVGVVVGGLVYAGRFMAVYARYRGVTPAAPPPVRNESTADGASAGNHERGYWESEPLYRSGVWLGCLISELADLCAPKLSGRGIRRVFATQPVAQQSGTVGWTVTESVRTQGL